MITAEDVGDALFAGALAYVVVYGPALLSRGREEPRPTDEPAEFVNGAEVRA